MALFCVTYVLALGSVAASAQLTTQPVATPTPGPTAGVSPASSTDSAEADRKKAAAERKLKGQIRTLKSKIRANRRATWRWQDLSLKRRTATRYQERYWNDLQKLKRLAGQWHRRLLRARYIALHPANRWAWACIHRHEAGPEVGGWRAHTGNGYYGGLQMDKTFQRMYGRRLLAMMGTANKWPWFSQMHAAERARRKGRGYYPWPRTARACHLI
jgi:hypothetical protein